MNDNPNQITEVNPSLLLPKMQREAVNAGAYTYQRGENLFTNLYSQWISNSISYFNSDRYEYNNGWVTEAYWNPYYTYVLKNILDIKGMAEKYPNYEEMYHIARIVAALGAARTTDIFGDIPYAEAGRGADKPKYDAQKDVYYDILNELKEATTALSAGFSSEQVKYASQDLFYGGNVEKWIKFGNSLRLRFALRISFADPEKAKQEGEAALASKLMELVDDRAYTITANIDDGHPMFVISNWNEFRMSATFERIYKTKSTVFDPRMELRWGVTQQSITDGSPEIKGIPNGLPGDQLPEYDVSSNPWGLLWAPTWNSAYVKPSSFTQPYPFDVMNYSEVCFLKAEAAIRGWANAGNAQTNYENGIRASFDEARLGVSTDLYSTANDDTYISTGIVQWNDGDDFEAKLEKIITQKWISLFPNGTEGWAEVRRTGYPALTPVVRSDDPSINAANGEFIKKLRYINMELESNEENARSASLNGGKGDGQNVRVWWDTGRYK
jgi:hypothetical protein